MNADEVAFPMQDAAVNKINACAGLTKREYFAVMIHSALMSKPILFCTMEESAVRSLRAQMVSDAVANADALLAALSKPAPPPEKGE